MMKSFDCSFSQHQELPRFQELIFEDFSRFILVENIFEEVVLQSVMKDIMMGQSVSVCAQVNIWGIKMMLFMVMCMYEKKFRSLTSEYLQAFSFLHEKSFK